MTRPLRLAVAGGHASALDYYREILPTLGHEVVLAVRTGGALIEGCLASHPDLVILDVPMPDHDGLDAVAALVLEWPAPVVLVAEAHDRALIERSGREFLFAYLHKPVRPPDLEMAIALARRRFEMYQALRAEAASLRRDLEDRKLVERAKGLLMRRASLDEEGAFRRLQRLARDSNRKLAEVARSLLLAEEAFQPVAVDGVIPGRGRRSW